MKPDNANEICQMENFSSPRHDDTSLGSHTRNSADEVAAEHATVAASSLMILPALRTADEKQLL